MKNFECCFLRQILTTVMLKIDRFFDHFWANFNYDNSKNREIQPLGLDLAQKWSNNLIFKNWDLAILNFRPCIFSVNCIPEAPSWVLTNSPFSLSPQLRAKCEINFCIKSWNYRFLDEKFCELYHCRWQRKWLDKFILKLSDF